ncbi:MAG: ion channel [Burkholderiales bacterium]|jgi:hypothetical protein
MSTRQIIANSISGKRAERGLATLFFALLFFLVSYPLFEARSMASIGLDVLFSIILISSTYALSHQRKVLVAALVLGVPTFASWWLVRFFDTSALNLFGLAVSIAFFVFVIGVIMTTLISRDEVTADLIFGAMSVYLLIGVAWAFLYAFVELLSPGQFNFGSLISEAAIRESHGELRLFTYFSLVTLSTLGYGDITPLTPLARSLASLEAVAGQLFIAVLIGRLVGMHISQRRKT